MGPLQVEARIDQNAQLSGQFTLWNQQGSRVQRGDLLVIPIGKSLLYVEPVYLKAESSPDAGIAPGSACHAGPFWRMGRAIRKRLRTSSASLQNRLSKRVRKLKSSLKRVLKRQYRNKNPRLLRILYARLQATCRTIDDSLQRENSAKQGKNSNQLPKLWRN